MQITWRSAPSRRSLSPTAARRVAADAGVDLVEDERPRAAARGRGP